MHPLGLLLDWCYAPLHSVDLATILIKIQAKCLSSIQGYATQQGFVFRSLLSKTKQGIFSFYTI